MPTPRRFVPIASALVLVVTLAFTAPAADKAAASDEEGFVKLFNGKDLTGWFYGTENGKEKKAGEGYRAKPEAGVIYCTEKDGGNLYTEKEYANFVFRFEFKLTPGANNGLGIRAPREGNAAYEGIELQILDDTAEKYAKLRPEQYHGSIYDVIATKRGHLKPVGEWNEQEVTADGRRIKVVLNGSTIVDANLDDVTDEAKLKKHPGLARTSGHLGFLGHGAALEFRNLRIKELPPAPAPAPPAATTK
jgi:hypothetical protein